MIALALHNTIILITTHLSTLKSINQLIQVKGRKGAVDVVDTDEGPRFGCKIGDLTKLKSVFVEDGMVTAGSASGITDGAASLVIAGTYV